MDVDLTPVSNEERPVFTRLLQLYYYDFSELLGFDVGDDGLFTTSRAEGYWLEPRYHPFLIRAGGRLAGLAIVDSQSRLSGHDGGAPDTPGEPCWDMSEFFVLRRHRRAGVGARAAVAAFEAFPGRWEVRQATRNTPAQAFWREVIGRHTGGHFHEVAVDDARWHGPVQMFTSTRPQGA
jgi:predicted acetyltransferase